jgi:predicted phage terminase large subunit-like protein
MPMLVPGGKLLVIGTRYNEADLYATLQGGGMRALMYPAEDADGHILWPERFSRETLDARRVWPQGSPYSYASQYLCNPVPAEGSLFRASWWQYWTPETLPKQFDEWLCSWDCTFKGEETSDFVVGQVWARKDADFYLIDQVRERADFPATLMLVRGLRKRWPQVLLTLVEDKANGSAVIAMLRKELPGLVASKADVSTGGKTARAQAVAPMVQSGNVHLPAGAPWVSDFVAECAAFPNAAHDDQVDSMSQGLARWVWAEAAKVEPLPLDHTLRTVESVIAQRRLYGMFAQQEGPDEYVA